MLKELTGYPATDKPWLKYYTKEAINTPLPECTIYEYLYQNNKDHLGDIALNYFDHKITYGELFENIEKTAKAFTAMGVKKGDIVTVCSVTTPEIIYAFYGLNRIGAISNMVDPRTSTDGIKHYIEEVQSKLVVTIDVALPKIEKSVMGTIVEKIITVSPLNSIPQPKKAIATFANKLKGNKVKLSVNCIDWNNFCNNTAEPKYAEYKKDTCCVIVHTGGTTGTPKGVMLSNDNLNAIAHQYFYGIETERKQKFLNIMPPFIAYGVVIGIHMPMCCGNTIVIIPQFNPQELGRLIKKYQPHHFCGVPSHLQVLMKTPNIDLSCLVSPGAGGDAISMETEQEVNDFLLSHGCKHKMAKGYGMTEMCATACVCTGNHTNVLGNTGIPLCNNVFSMFDAETNNELKYGELGEICITGPGMMLGYFGNQEETNKMIRIHADGKKWIHTGDIGTVTEEGFVYIKGRKKRLIVRYDGFKVFPTQIESVILKNNNIKDCCVVGIPDNSNSQGMIPIVFAILKNEKSNSNIKLELIALCKSKLPEYAQPIDFIFIDKFPLTPIGKVDFIKLEQVAEEKMY